MSSKRPHSSDKSKMFHSLVLMGSGLALGCGGVAKVDGSSAAGSAATGHGGTSGAGAGAATGVGAAGAGNSLVIGPSGGTLGYAGAVSAGGALGVAGSTFNGASGGTTATETLPCPPSQWACATPPSCQFRTGASLGTGCKCDSSRPARASDCKPDQSFVCIDVTSDAHGNGIYPPVSFACSCLTTPVDCSAACDAAYGSGVYSCFFIDNSGILCGCAAPVVLK